MRFSQCPDVFDAYLHLLLFPVFTYNGGMKDTSISERRKALKQRNFLHMFQRTGTLSEGAKAAGVSRQAVYYWKKTSPLFVARMRKALDHFELTDDGYRIAAICVLARVGDQHMQDYIRKNYGSSILKKVMHGMKLTAKGLVL